MAQRENAKDIVILYEEDAEEWALYLREIFLHAVQREAILLYPLESFSLPHLESLSLNSYKCKLLILSNSLLKDLTPKKCRFLEKVLHSSESVVTLLCGMESSDPLYGLLKIPGSRWEVSTEQEPEDYISVIRRIIVRGPEDYLEVSSSTDLGMKHSGEMSKKKEIGAPEASRPAMPQVMVLPAEIPCENPGEIFILLKDEIIGETLEVEFISNNKCIRAWPSLWNKTVWHMKALDFPAGSVAVNIRCDGLIKATTEIKYSSAAKPMESAFRESDPGDRLCQNNIEELDDVLTSVFKHEIPYYEFKVPQIEICPQKERTQVKEFPTLLHCAAKFGLKNLAVHLLQCSGATWEAQMKNMYGSDLAHIAERHGHKELKKIFEDFTKENISREREREREREEPGLPFPAYSPATQSPTFHHEIRKTPRLSAEGNEEPEMAGRAEEEEPGARARLRLPEVSESSENQYDDLYVFIPGLDAKNSSQESVACCRPPLPPPRPGSAASQLERPHFTLQGKMMEDEMERNQNWTDPSAGQETGDGSKEEEEEDGTEQEEEENPYTFAETEDNEYDLILASLSIRKKTGNRSFIINRPPAPTPRPIYVPPKEEATPYIAQVFQQKAARRQSDGDKFHGPPKKPDKARMEGSTFSIARDCLTAGQEELIRLQEKVKNGKMSVDEALEKFKHWQIGKSGLELIQQEKLRQLRDTIIGKRPEEENAYDKLTIIHHPSGNSAHNENVLNSIPFNSKFPTRLQLEKESGFCCKKDH
ncbi:B-cell scaffold protein with ankyrin repeats [Nannospalax galili]|uniref:B-cell scaffold protein with ankyrin repeats n=1 Tax=Nannospalax galili TaxID=1026970 RepID=UPI000819E5E7|nr:B-cell scaffold protein with ankyrin repeats [Nannospalax galili]